MKKLKIVFYSVVLLFLSSVNLNAQGVEIRQLSEKNELFKNGFFGRRIEAELLVISQGVIENSLAQRESNLSDIHNILDPVPGFTIPVGFHSDAYSSPLTTSGGTVRKLSISAPGADAIGLNFDQFNLQPGAVLIFYSEKNNYLIGPLHGDDFYKVNTYSTEFIPGDLVHIELFEPHSVAIKSNFHISVINYIKDHSSSTDTSGEDSKVTSRSLPLDCNINVICPLGDNLRNQRDGVTRIIAYKPNTNGFFGTGSLISNSSNDFEPLVLTAFHLIDLNGDGAIDSAELSWLNSMKLLFFYESGQCDPLIPSPVDMNSTFTGVSLVSCNSDLDFALLRINNATLDTRFFFNGWDRRSISSLLNVFSLHHPRGNNMKVSYSPTAGTLFSKYRTEWLEGITENGSSGAPLLNSNGLVVGYLQGGSIFNSCNLSRLAIFNKISSAWTGGGAPENRLKDWLDPSNTGIQYQYGRRPHSITGPVLLCGPGTYHFEYLSTGIDTNEITWSVPAFSATGTGTKATIYVTGNEEPGRWWITFSSPRQNGGEITLTKEFVLSGLDLSPYTNVQVYDTEDIPVPMEYGVFMLDLNEEYRLYASTYTGSPFYAPVTNWNWNIPIDWELLSNDPSFSEIRIKTPSEISPLMLRQGDPATVDVFDNYCQIWNYSAGWANYGYNAPPPEGFVFAFSPNPILNTIYIKRISKEMASKQSWIVLEAEKSGMKLSSDDYLVRILNERGLFFEKRYRTDEFSLDLSSLSEGTYFIHVLVGEAVFRGKFIKERQEFEVSQSGQK